MNIQISRREALLGSGALIVSFSLAGSLSMRWRKPAPSRSR